MSTGELEPGALAEATLVSRASEGDLASFEVLVRRYQGPVFRLALRMLADRGEAEDVVQDTFVLVWRRLPTLNDPARFHGWIYQVATRRCLDQLRTRLRPAAPPTEAADLEPADLEPADLEPADLEPADLEPVDLEISDGTTRATPVAVADPAVAVERAAEPAGLDVVLQTLTDEQRACWVLHELHELTYPEIARATNLPVATVRERIARARQGLAKGMDPWR